MHGDGNCLKALIFAHLLDLGKAGQFQDIMLDGLQADQLIELFHGISLRLCGNLRGRGRGSLHSLLLSEHFLCLFECIVSLLQRLLIRDRSLGCLVYILGHPADTLI